MPIMPSPNSHPEIWLIRHGETAWSLSGAHTGRTDIPLTAAGDRQAEAIGRYLAGRPFALVLTSPLQRAHETCRLAGYSGVARMDPDLREWDYGAYEGRTSAQIQESVPDWTIWTSPVPQGETIQQVAARASRGVERAAGAHAGGAGPRAGERRPGGPTGPAGGAQGKPAGGGPAAPARVTGRGGAAAAVGARSM